MEVITAAHISHMVRRSEESIVDHMKLIASDQQSDTLLLKSGLFKMGV
jgi:hypothetical protein